MVKVWRVRRKEGATSPPVDETCKPTPTKTLKTEDTGKMFEMAICLAYGIPYDGKYKYSMEKPQKMKARLEKLLSLFPKCVHTGKRGARYDFTDLSDASNHLSAKSTKKGVGKVAPQVVGQSQPKKFCETLGVAFQDISALKKYIQSNITTILPVLVEYTFDCPTVYYNEEKDTIRYIKLSSPIEWSSYEFSWTCDWNTWANSSTVKIKVGEVYVPLVEFQFHTKSRTNMAVRWFYENFLTVFKENLTILDF